MLKLFGLELNNFLASFDKASNEMGKIENAIINRVAEILRKLHFEHHR